MLPSNTHKIVGGPTVTGIIERSGIDGNQLYAIDGFALHELLVLATRIGNYRFDDPDEKRDWQNRLNGMVDAVRRLGALT